MVKLKPARNAMKSIARGDGEKTECPQGHRKVGKNLLWRTVRGRLVRGCRVCNTNHVIAYQKRKRGERGGPMGASGRNERILPLAPRLMATLIEVYRDGGCMPETYADRAKLELPTVYVMLGRLAAAGWVVSTTTWEAHPLTGKKVNRARYECTDVGFKLVNGWLGFLQDVGPEIAKMIRWQER